MRLDIKTTIKNVDGASYFIYPYDYDLVLATNITPIGCVRVHYADYYTTKTETISNLLENFSQFTKYSIKTFYWTLTSS